jgi:hypothetical protein
MTRLLAGAAAVLLAFHGGQTFRSGAEAVLVDALVRLISRSATPVCCNASTRSPSRTCL